MNNSIESILPTELSIIVTEYLYDPLFNIRKELEDCVSHSIKYKFLSNELFIINKYLNKLFLKNLFKIIFTRKYHQDRLQKRKLKRL